MSNTARTEAVVGLTLVTLLLVVGSALTDIKDPNPDLRASTFVNDKSGIRALYLLLDEVGVPTERLLSPVAADDPTDRTVVMSAPSVPVLEPELDALLDWVDAGGRLVVVNQPPAAPVHQVYTEETLSALGYGSGHFMERDSVVDVSPSPALPRGYERLVWPVRRRFSERSQNGDQPMLRTTDERSGPPVALFEPWGVPVVMSFEFGESGGEIVVVADTVGLDNQGLGNAQNALLAVDLMTGDRSAVLFDEFHHGFSEDGERPNLAASLLALLPGTWPGRAILVLFLAGGVHLAGAAVRFGAPFVARQRRSRALTEHTDALGRIYENARARARALDLLAAGARRAVGPRVGLSPRMPAAEFDRRLSAGTAPGAHELSQALTAARTAAQLGATEFARIARDLALAKRRFIHARV